MLNVFAILRVPIFVTLSSAGTLCCPAEHAKIDVMFLPQAHKSPIQSAQNRSTSDVARSQFMIFNELTKKSMPTVFVEGHLEPPSKRSFYLHAKDLGLDLALHFQKGFIPKFFKDLSQEQVMALEELGGAEIASYLGLITKIIPVESKENLKLMLAMVESLRRAPVELQEEMYSHVRNFSPINKKILEDRERQALNAIRIYVDSAEYQNEPVVMIFGANHQFEMRREYGIRFENRCTDYLER